ncbi:MAG: thiol:disulfide interchange protein DsbA/DsbL [Rhodocyclaceae bacterium]|nr:thiol:disulfide interchange protein DsbA/DsbL [Rhodocyclaceae bacterium]
MQTSSKNLVKMITGAAATLAATFFLGAAAAQGSREVSLLDPPQSVPNDGKIEVLEFFSYGCGACSIVEPPLEAWVKRLPPDVSFRAVPAGLNLMGVDEITVFHTLDAMGQRERLHKKIFEALHNERVILGHKPTYLKWLEKNGVDPKQYESVEQSFTVQSKVKRGRQLMGLYKVTGTPTIVVNGRVMVHFLGNASAMLATTDRVINELRAQNVANPASSTRPPAPAKANTRAAEPAKK